MQKALIAFFLLTTVTAVNADDKACILKAAELLPRIAGLSIEESTIRPVPEKYMADFKSDQKPVLVDIKINAAGQKDTYSYLCLMAGSRPLVQRVVN